MAHSKNFGRQRISHLLYWSNRPEIGAPYSFYLISGVVYMFAKIQAQILLLNDDLTTLIPCDELYLRLRWADFDEILAGSPVFIGDKIT